MTTEQKPLVREYIKKRDWHSLDEMALAYGLDGLSETQRDYLRSMADDLIREGIKSPEENRHKTFTTNFIY